MAIVEIDVPEIGRVKLFRRRGLKNIRVSIDRSGHIRLSLPWYVPKSVGIVFLKSKKSWLEEKGREQAKNWHNGQRLTSDIFLHIENSSNGRLSTKILPGKLVIYLPVLYSETDKRGAINRSVKKFLKTECEKHIIPRVNNTAQLNGYKINSVTVKNLKARWGSCDQNRNITINSSLINLSEEMIHYVISHELVHTNHLNHSRAFWAELESLVPDFRRIKRELNKVSIFA